MAEAQASQLFGGYDEDFVNAVEDELQCAICQLPLKDPILTKCGHRFCRKCLDEHFRRLEHDRQEFSCPVDRNVLIPDKDTFADKATERKILSFVIKCPSNGCQWTGELRSKDNHLASCPLKVVSCTNENCHVTLTRNKLQEHVTTTCPWMIIKCNHCSASHLACKTKTHQSECRRFPCYCPKSCRAVIPREEISLHTERDCPLTIISCQYSEMGCTVKVQRREVELHLNSATRLHLDLACLKLHDTQKEFKETTCKLEDRVNALENVLIMMQRPVVNTWKVTGVSEILRQAKSGKKDRTESPPFYNCGYRFILSLCLLNYYAFSLYTPFLSDHKVFLKLIKGEYDAILPWPFHKKVTFTLIDQQENPNVDRKNNIVQSFITNPENKSCFARPVTDENKMYDLNCLVIRHNILRRYTVDDTIIIQVQFTPPE